MTPSEWLGRLGADQTLLRETYGNDDALVHSSLALWVRTLNRFRERFGEREVRLFRSPGRINLRGMHVDTHGGFLNLMTHHRETVVVAGIAKTPETTAINANAAFPEISFSLHELAGLPAFGASWIDYITAAPVRERVGKSAGAWANYVEGSALSVQHRLRNHAVPELCLAVGSSLPQGAALSSSAALCTGLVLAFAAWAEHELSPEDMILAARDGEWYAGSRCGVSDQAAMVLGKPGHCINIALQSSRLDVSGGRHYAFPGAMHVLVVDSHTERSLSGNELVAYTQNRFAYSMALHVCRQQLASLGVPRDAVEAIDSLPALAPHALEEFGGLSLLYRMLLGIPETMNLETLRQAFEIPNIDALYLQHFGNVPEDLRPLEFHMRGPLLYGIAESERARLFPKAIEDADWESAGQLMLTGHAGDRRVQPDGAPHFFDAGDNAIARLARTEVPIESCPGAYGASTPALDSLVDKAMAAGALGACLTGAGLAGSVLVLCRKDDSSRIAADLRDWLASEKYARAAGLPNPLTEHQVLDSVVVNRAIAGVGEIRL